MAQQWHITAIGSTSIKIKEDTTNIIIVLPLGAIMFRKDETDLLGKHFFVDGMNNNILYRINSDDMVTPPFTGTLETYLEALGSTTGSSSGGGGC